MRCRMRLLILGAVCELVYLAASVRLPWWRYGSRLSSWSQLLAPVGADDSTKLGPFFACVAGVAILLVAHLSGWSAVRHSVRPRSECQLIWAFSGIFVITLFWLQPITSDLFTYLSQAHQLSDLGANPLAAAALAPPDDSVGAGRLVDPLIDRYATHYSRHPSMYGPAWILLAALGTLGPFDPLAGLAYLKGLGALAFLGGAWLLERIVSAVRPDDAQEALYLFSWNPLLLLMTVGDGHNDLVMMAAVLLAMWLMVRGSWVPAFASLTVSVWIKYVSALFLPFFALILWHRSAGAAQHSRHPLSSGARRIRIAGQAPGKCGGWPVVLCGAATCALLSGLVLLPFGPVGWIAEAGQRFLHPANWRVPGAALSSEALAVGLACLAPAYLLLLLWTALRVRLAPAHVPQASAKGSDPCPLSQEVQPLLDACFAAALMAFLFGAARSQPWHLVWPASLAGLSRWGWAWPVIITLSTAMLVAQLWIEWGTPWLEL